jgi:hypothetical protein
MKTRSLSLLAAAGALALFALAAPEPISGQNLPVDSDAQLKALIAELTAQNAQLAKNQEEMDAKIDQIAEAVRQARIFAARGGKGGAKK